MFHPVPLSGRDASLLRNKRRCIYGNDEGLFGICHGAAACGGGQPSHDGGVRALLPWPGVWRIV